jgi:iron complex transport system ATP-binding protein
MASLMTTTDLNVKRGRILAVSKISFSLRMGEFLTILGPNGAGKSTLVETLCGRHQPAGGSLSFLGRPHAAWEDSWLAKHRAVLSQKNSISLPFSVYQVVAMGRFPFVESKDESHRIVQKILEQLDLRDLEDRPYQKLSGGEAQRVQLARSLCQLGGGDLKNKLLVLDEPTNNLDPRYTYEILSIVRDLCVQGLTVLAVLHDFALALEYSDRLLLLKDGALQSLGEPTNVLESKAMESTFHLNLKVHSFEGKPIVIHHPKERT